MLNSGVVDQSMFMIYDLHIVAIDTIKPVITVMVHQ